MENNYHVEGAMKIDALTCEYGHCGECARVEEHKNGWRCTKAGKMVKALWGDIPDWCPLPDKKEGK